MNRIGISGLLVVSLTSMLVTPQQKAAKPKAETKEAKIARALSAGPPNIAKAAKVVDDIAYCANADALQWEEDWHGHKPKPTNPQPGIEYMLAGGTYWSATDPYATSGTPFTEGPHWIILWPFDPATTGLPEQLKQTGTWIMWAGTPYSHLMINQRP